MAKRILRSELRKDRPKRTIQSGKCQDVHHMDFLGYNGALAKILNDLWRPTEKCENDCN